MRALLIATLTLAFALSRAQAQEAGTVSETEVETVAEAAAETETVAETEIRLLPPDPCVRLTVALSELDRAGARASCLASVRRANREDRIDEGVLLLGWGAMSLVAGAVVAGVGVEDHDDLWLGFGLGTAGWGLVNALLSLSLLDLDGGGLRDIEADGALSGEALERAREDAAAAQYQTGTILAVNAGLDAFYVITGILLFVLGEQAAPDERGLMGYGAAMAAQGAMLLGYDTVTWLFASARGDRLRTLLRAP